MEMRDKSKYADGEKHSGWKISGTSLAFGLYDKAREVEKYGKTYIYEAETGRAELRGKASGGLRRDSGGRSCMSTG